MATPPHEVVDALHAHNVLIAPSEIEREAVREYQSPFGTYALLNALLRPGAAWDLVDVSTVLPLSRLTERLIGLIDRSLLPIPLTVYRGVGDVALTLGGEPVVGREYRLFGFASTSLNQDVAADFAEGTRPAVLELSLRAGTTALWVPGLGDPRLDGEHEVLLPPGTVINIRDVDPHGATLKLSCEVCL